VTSEKKTVVSAIPWLILPSLMSLVKAEGGSYASPTALNQTSQDAYTWHPVYAGTGAGAL